MTIDHEIFLGMDAATATERKVARVLLAGYPGTGLISANQLARRAGTSTPTVLRLINRLGYDGYPEFQSRLRDELSHTEGSPLARSQADVAGGVEHSFRRMLADRVGIIEALADCVPPGEFDRAVEMLASPPKHTVVSGGYFSRYLAMLLADQLDEIVPGVDHAADPLAHDIGKYLRLGRAGVAVVLDFRRHEQDALDAARLAREQGARVIVLTDPSLSPAAEHADIVLPAPVGGVPFDSMAPLLVLIEALVNGVLQATGDRGLDRMRRRERFSRPHRARPTAREP